MIVLALVLAFYTGFFVGCLISSRRRRAAEDRADRAEYQRDQLMETIADRTDQAKGEGHETKSFD